MPLEYLFDFNRINVIIYISLFDCKGQEERRRNLIIQWPALNKIYRVGKSKAIQKKYSTKGCLFGMFSPVQDPAFHNRSKCLVTLLFIVYGFHYRRDFVCALVFLRLHTCFTLEICYDTYCVSVRKNSSEPYYVANAFIFSRGNVKLWWTNWLPYIQFISPCDAPSFCQADATSPPVMQQSFCRVYATSSMAVALLSETAVYIRRTLGERFFFLVYNHRDLSGTAAIILQSDFKMSSLLSID